MNSIFRVLWIAAVAGFCSLAAVAYAAAPQGYLYEVRGDVRATIGSGKPAVVKQGETLVNGTTILTGANSLAVLRFLDGTVIALNQNTAFTIQKYAYDEKSPSLMSAFFSMVRGGLRVVTGQLSQRNREAFRVATPSATIGIRGTEFLVESVNPTTVLGISGVTTMSNAAGELSVGPKQIGFTPSATTAPMQISTLAPGTASNFGNLQKITLPPNTPTSVPAGSGAGVSGATGGIGGAAVGGAAAAAAAAAAALSRGENAPGATTGSTGTSGTR